jgi:hypothetical protein
MTSVHSSGSDNMDAIGGGSEAMQSGIVAE